MDEAAVVRCVERRGELLEQLHRPVRVDRAVLEQDLAQVGSGHVVHDEEQHPVVLAGVVDSHHVGVVQRSGDPHLPLEALAELLVLSQGRRQHLERIDSVQRDVCGPVDQAHAAATDQLVDSVSANYRATLQLVASHCHVWILSGAALREL